MSLCKINIRSEGSGWTDNQSVSGEIFETEREVTFLYSLFGDGCSLSVKDGLVTQERRGRQYVKISFAEGEETQCVIGDGAAFGSYKVFTRKLKFFSGKGGYKLSLEYLNGSDAELIKLTFTAVKKGK